MILTDKDIYQKIAEGELVIENLSDPDLQVQPASIDLRVGTEFLEFSLDAETHVDPAQGGNLLEYGSEVSLSKGDEYELPPGGFVHGTTREIIDMPENTVGVLHGRSTYGRLGLVPHTGAGFVNPGWHGHLTLELANQGPHTITLRAGESRVIQLVLFSTLSDPEVPYNKREGAQHHNQGT